MRGGKREGAGRPKKSQTLVRPVQVRFSMQEWDILKAAAEYEGKTVSQFIRDIITAYTIR